MGNWASKAGSGGSKRLEGKVVGQRFTDIFPFGDDQEAGDSIYWVISILADGADEPEDKAMYLGSGEYLRIVDENLEDVEEADGGHTGPILMSTDEDGSPRLYDKGEVMRFIQSLEELGFPAETRFPDPSESKTIDLRGILGSRLIIGDEIDRESQIAIGRKALVKKLGPAKGAKATEEECLEAGKRQVTKGKHKGKSFNRTRLVCLKVVEVPDGDTDAADDDDEKPAKKSAKGSKAVEKSSKKSAKADDDDDEEEDEDDAEESEDEESDDEDDSDDEDEQEAGPSTKTLDKVMTAILKKEKGNKAKKDGLVLLVTRHCSANKMDKDEATAIRKAFNDDKVLAGMAKRGVIAKFTPGKNPVIELA